MANTTAASSTRRKEGYWARLFKSLNRTKFLQLLLLPGLIYYIVFQYVPMYGVIIAFKDYKIREGILGSDWVGLQHFKDFFNYMYSWRIIRNTVLLNFYNLIFGFPMPIIFAILLNEVRNLRYKKFVQTISYMPHFISTVSIVGILTMILSPTSGIVNVLISKLGGTPIYFMTRPEWFRTIYVASGVWQDLGWDAIIYIAALASVNQELYEAAVIDGASRLKQIWHVSLPGIRSTIVIMLIMRMGSMMSSNTDKVLLMQNELTYDVSDIIGTYVYRRGIRDADYSYSTAVGLFNSVINVIFVVAANTIAKKLGESSLW
ncbi:MAG: ABC transporter permease [Lachnospirales bacterium]